MHKGRRLTFVVAANNPEVLQTNFLRSPCLQNGLHQVLVQWGFPSATKAYNEAIDRAANDLLVCVHQDVYLPEAWESQLETSLDSLSGPDPTWGVLGCYGATRDGAFKGYLYSSCQQVHGCPFAQPESVQTLDEIVLIFRKSTGLRFDADLPHFHLYGSDICLRAAECGRRSYAICAPCIHNTAQNIVLPPDFYRCCRYFVKKHRRFLPVQTTCIRLTRDMRCVYARRLRELYLRMIGAHVKAQHRVASVEALIEDFARISGLAAHDCESAANT